MKTTLSRRLAAIMISTVCASAAVAVAAGPALAVPPPPPCQRSVAVGDVTATEGTAPFGTFFPYKPFVFTISSTGCLAAAGTVGFETVHGTADTSDYFAKSGTLTLTGDAPATITVYVWMDGCTGFDDTFWLKLSGGGLLSPIRLVDAWGQATIVNDDGPLQGAPSEVLPDPQCVR